MRNRGLWYKEWLGIRWFALVIFILFLGGIFWGIFNDVNRWHETVDYYDSDAFAEMQKESKDDYMTAEDINNSLTVVYLVQPNYEPFINPAYVDSTNFVFYFPYSLFFLFIKIAVFGLGLFLVLFERFTRGNRLMATLPYKRSRVMAVRLIITSSVITMSFLISVGLGLLYINQSIDPDFIQWDVSRLLLLLGSSWLSYLLLFLSAIVIGLAIASPLAGVLIGMGTIFVPNVLITSIDKLFLMKANHLATIQEMKSIIPLEDCINIFAPFNMQSDSAFVPLFYGVLALSLTVLAILMYKYQAIEKNGQLFAFDWIKWVVYGGFSISTALAITNLIDGNYTKGLQMNTYFVIAGLIAVVLFIAIAVIVKRLMAYFQMAKTS
ncbi:hypothetical protein [Listeria costaricensis]|uniref:hypothetical protein n=1 Tax=Listeria costaricensis TaxID=2026604 RepID=UPI000C0748D5|nr:hypothetical protein [Listeria costaricensis]